MVLCSQHSPRPLRLLRTYIRDDRNTHGANTGETPSGPGQQQMSEIQTGVGSKQTYYGANGARRMRRGRVMLVPCRVTAATDNSTPKTRRQHRREG